MTLKTILAKKNQTMMKLKKMPEAGETYAKKMLILRLTIFYEKTCHKTFSQ